MNYINIINNAWELREQGIISVHEHDLFNYLVHKCNRLNWKNPFNQSTEIICAVLGISRNTLINRRKRLQQLGLITFRKGVAKTKPAEYTLIHIAQNGVDEPEKRNSIKTVKTTRTTFKKPTVNEINEYCLLRQNQISAQTFFDFYEAKNWMIGRNKMKDWQAAVRTWESKQIDNRHNIAKHNNSKNHVRF